MAELNSLTTQPTCLTTQVVRPTQSSQQLQTVGKYQIVSELGRGACGVVYRALDPFVDREVAIKVASSQAFNAGREKSPQELREEFFAEARAAGRLQHPHIVSVFDAGSERDLNYIVMEYVDGETLGKIARSSPEPQRIVEMAFECSKALDYAHRAGVLHRDIKPDNIMLRRDGTTKLLDFSIASMMQNQRVQQDVVVGTPAFMAPEQVAGLDIGPETDLYSLGAVLYHALSGHPPHQAANRSQLLKLIRTTRPKPIGVLRPELPEALCSIVDRLLALDPTERFVSGHELSLALLKVFDRRAVSLRRTPHNAERLALAALDFCRDMSTDQIDELLAAGRIRRFVAGEQIYSEEQDDTNFYLIVLGEVTVHDGTPVTLRQSEIFGALALPGVSTQGTKAVANNDGLLLQISRERLRECSPACQLLVYQACCSEMRYHLSLLTTLAGG